MHPGQFPNTSLLVVSGRTPSFNFQCLRPQSTVDDLPIPGTYRGNTSPSRSRLQVKQCRKHTRTHNVKMLVLTHRVSLALFHWSSPALADPAQPGLPAQQCVFDVIRLLGEHSSSRHHSCSRNDRPLGTQGQAHLHPYGPGGPSLRHQPAAVERRVCQPPCGKPSIRLVPRSDEDLHQREDATGQPNGQPGLHGQRQRRQSGRVGE